MPKKVMTGFDDHFSRQAETYRRFRPLYPPELFVHLAKVCKKTDLAWDVGTGNGQAAQGLVQHFHRVVGTDASFKQIQEAMEHSRIKYRVTGAENSHLADASVDLVLAAQSFHWFDPQPFFHEVQRVLVPGGVIALVSYGVFSVSPELDPILMDFYSKKVGPYWPMERKLVEEGYRGVNFPFLEFEFPPLEMSEIWSLSQILGYVESWSATQRYLEKKGKNPVNELSRELRPLWDLDVTHKVTWPLAVRIGRTKE